MFKEIARALPDVRDDSLDRKLREAEVAPRVVHGPGEVGASVEESSVNIEEYCWHGRSWSSELELESGVRDLGVRG